MLGVGDLYTKRMDDLRRRFGNLVAAHRRQQGLTQEALATSASLSVDMVSRIEAGASGARFPTIEKLARALQVDPAEFFSANVPSSALERALLTDICARLAKLDDDDLKWVANVLAVVLKHR